MNERRTLRKDTRAWYGPTVVITVASDHRHRVVVGGIPIPHIGLVNMIARWRMPTEQRLTLTADHELGHIQTFPLILLYLLLLASRCKKRFAWRRCLAGLVTHHAAWELAAECYVLIHHKDTRPYSSQGRVLYGLLWSGMAALAIFSANLVLRD